MVRPPRDRLVKIYKLTKDKISRMDQKEAEETPLRQVLLTSMFEVLTPQDIATPFDGHLSTANLIDEFIQFARIYDPDLLMRKYHLSSYEVQLSML